MSILDDLKEAVPLQFVLPAISAVFLVAVGVWWDGRTSGRPAVLPTAERSAPTLSEMYPGPWREDFDLGISRALVQSKVTGCGQYKFRASATQSGEFLVHCSRDGVHWRAYFVWTRIEEAEGPYSVDPTVQ